MVGLPGSGKSTFARGLAPRIDAIGLESDALRRLLFGRPAYSSAENRALFDALHEAARVLLDRGLSVIIDATSLKESDRAPVYDLARASRARLVVLHLSATEAVIEERLARRLHSPDTGDHSSAGIEVYRRLAARAEPVSRAHLRLDTDDAATYEASLERAALACGENSPDLGSDGSSTRRDEAAGRNS